MKRNLRYAITEPGLTLLQPRGAAHCVVTFNDREDRLALVYGWEGIDISDDERLKYCFNNYSTGISVVAFEQRLIHKIGLLEFYFLVRERSWKGHCSV